MRLEQLTERLAMPEIEQLTELGLYERRTKLTCVRKVQLVTPALDRMRQGLAMQMIVDVSRVCPMVAGMARCLPVQN